MIHRIFFIFFYTIHLISLTFLPPSFTQSLTRDARRGTWLLFCSWRWWSEYREREREREQREVVVKGEGYGM